jgi:hypothetical protein
MYRPQQLALKYLTAAIALFGVMIIAPRGQGRVHPAALVCASFLATALPMQVSARVEEHKEIIYRTVDEVKGDLAKRAIGCCRSWAGATTPPCRTRSRRLRRTL